MYKIKKSIMDRGFTILELLVVLAIIGILAAIVIVALTDARNKGAVAGVKSNLNSSRSQAEVFYNVNTAAPNTYTNVCTNGAVGGVQGIGLMVLSAAKAAGLSTYTINGTGSLTTATCNDSATAWMAEAPLKGVGGMWCVDSTGKAQRDTVSAGAATACN